jgi:hypothetical protein
VVVLLFIFDAALFGKQHFTLLFCEEGATNSIHDHAQTFFPCALAPGLLPFHNR